jgi:hypothetical protein
MSTSEAEKQTVKSKLHRLGLNSPGQPFLK